MKTLRVGIIGIPSTGKSSFINLITDNFIGAVSSKPQTTQETILGVIKNENLQIIFYDTPGISNSQLKSVQTINRFALHSLRYIDFGIFMFSVDKKITKDILELSSKIENKIAVINKIDLKSKSILLPIVEQIKETFPEIFFISCKTKEKIDDLKNFLFQTCEKIGKEDLEYQSVTNRSQKELFSDVTREIIFENMDKEVPYQVFVETQAIKPLETSLVIEQNIHISKNHRHIFLGVIKKLSIAARKKIETTFGISCHLYLHLNID